MPRIEEETWKLPKIGSKKQRIFYVPASFEHPAKMDVNLTRKLIKAFTKEGDVILDPMCGVGTTLVEATLLGRDAIGVDLEEKFTKLTNENLENVKKVNEKSFFKLKLGDSKVVTGDSRHLSQLLKENADAIVTSPPYSEQMQANADYEKRKERMEKLGLTKKTHGLLRGQKSSSKVIGGDERYSPNPENVGNLKHGNVDAVITSPPYSESMSKRRKGYTVIPELAKTREMPQDTKDDNIANLEHGELDPAIKRLRQHGRTNSKAGGPYGRSLAHPYSPNPENIGNLSHKQDVDTILTSPPYSGSSIQDYATSNKALLDFERQIRESFRTKGYFEYNGIKYTEKEWRRINKGELKPRGIPELWAKIVRRKKQTKYNDENPENIANLQHGKIDVVLTSPPYAETISDKGGGSEKHLVPEKDGCKIGKSSVQMRRIAKNPKNIANLAKGNVDAVITSPPYSSGGWKADENPANPIEREKKRKQKFPMRPPDPGRYSASPQNIGNLPHENNVDIILTSPPYADIHQCPTSTGWTEFFRKQLEEKGFIEWNGKRYTEAEWRAMNHGRIDGRSTPGMKKDAKYSKNPQNIGNLPHKESVDVVLTSPPYQNAVHDTLEKRKQWKEKELHEAKKGLPIGYSENPENIGNIKQHGKVDTIITSPPYEGTFNVKQHTLSGIAKRDPNFRKEVGGYGPNEANIGNLRRGKEGVDAILTSPPYGHESTASKPTKLEQQGLFKMGHSKEVPLTDEDYRTWALRNKGNIAKRKLFVRVPCKPEEAQFHDTRKGRKGTAWEWTKEVKVDLNNMDVQKEKSEKKGKTETYLSAMLKCYREMYAVLKPDGLCIVILKNFIRNWKVVDLVSDTQKLCAFIGFKLVKKIKFMLPTKSFWRILYQSQWKKKFGKPFPQKEFASVYDYETVLVFQK